MELVVLNGAQLETTIDIEDEVPLGEDEYQETIETIEISQELPIDNNKMAPFGGIPDFAGFAAFHQDPQDDPPDLDTNYSLRSCYIHVERCDKIWETMKLIRELQEPPSDSNDSNDEDTDSVDEDMALHTGEPIDDESNSSQPLPYIKYQPVLGNGNSALPNFQFAVKSTRALYQCNTCGRQYSHRKTLREHSERMHNIILPMIRRPPKFKERSDLMKTEDKEEVLDHPDDEDSTHESASSISSSPSEDKDRLVEADQELESISPSGKVRHLAVCRHCNRTLSDKYYLKVHETLIHGIVSTFIIGTGPMVLRNYIARAGEIINCSLCDYAFYGSQKLAEHMGIIHGISDAPPSSDVPGLAESSNDKVPKSSEKIPKSFDKVGKSLEKSPKITEKLVKNPLARKPIANKKAVPFVNEPKTELDKSKLKKSIPIAHTKGKSKKPTRTCEGCGKLYLNDTNWRVHLITVHGIIPNIQRTAPKKIVPKSLGIHNCKYCNKNFSHASTLRNHIILQHIRDQMNQKNVKPVKPMQVQRKGSTSSQKSSSSSKPPGPPPKLLKLPKQEKDVKPTVLTCTICNSTYCSRQSLHYHMANIHQIYQVRQRITKPGDPHKPHSCRGCPERFWSKKNLAIHQMIFHGIRRDPKPTNKVTKAVHVANQRSNGAGKAQGAIGKSPPSLPIQNSREKERLKAQEEVVYKTPKSPVKVKIEPNTSQALITGDEDVLIQCILCNRHCKKIKKHFIEFHKVRNPDMLMSQCKLSPLSPFNTRKETKPVIKKEPSEPVWPVMRKRRLDSMSQKKGLTVPGPNAPFELVLREVSGRRRRMYCCKSCTFMSYGYDSTRRHCKIEHPPAVATPRNPGVPGEATIQKEEQSEEKYSAVLQRRKSEGQLLSRKRRRESMDEREIQMRRISSVSGGELRMTRAVKRLKAELENKCENCERAFRNADILTAHRVSCKARPFESESNDTRESSDRDSGIGISITIKKKNDSYEIVSRDSSGERPTKRPNVDNYSNSFDTRETEDSGFEHRVIKLEKMDDDEVTADPEGDGFGVADAVAELPVLGVLSLRELCKRVLDHTRQAVTPKKASVKNVKAEKTSRAQCSVCKEWWPSTRARNTHSWMVHRVSAALSGYQPPSLRQMCVQSLELSGDKEARKKIWFPCHVCSTVWPTNKSRRFHAKLHDIRPTDNLLC